MIARWAAAVGIVAVLGAGCSSSSDPDPGAPGGKTELDGGETGTDSNTTTTPSSMEDGGSGGTTAGATEGNQIGPGDTTPSTAAQNP